MFGNIQLGLVKRSMTDGASSCYTFVSICQQHKSDDSFQTIFPVGRT
jgi:hypothetical protein